MNPNMNQMPQPEVLNSNSQIPIQNPPEIRSQNQVYEIVQSNLNKSRCEKLSEKLTGSSNIPLMVFIILMFSSLCFIVTLIFAPYPYFGCYLFAYLADFLFAIYVWSPMAIKIEKNTSTVRYGLLYLINNASLSIISLKFPISIQNIWSFILFETLLISLSNQEKKMKFFCCKINGKVIFYSAIVYHIVFNMIFFWNIILTIAYTFVYKKYLINKIAISNEKVEKIENFCLISSIKDKIQTFITLKEALENEVPQKQSLDSNNQFNNSSIAPINIYPNYYSGVAPTGQQMIPVQSSQHAEGIPRVESNENQQEQK
jgi:hypothetical protein